MSPRSGAPYGRPVPAGWKVIERWASAAAIHAMDFADVFAAGAPKPTVMIASPSASAIVLGSAQRVDEATAGRARCMGLDLVRRRSGGGAVAVHPPDLVWVDIWIPRSDPRWVDDVGVSMHWVGEAWAAAARALGVDAVVHRGPMRADALARQVCFVGLGPGEVTVGGRKLVGISQRRGRHGARFQCSWIRRWDPDDLLAVLGVDDPVALERVRSAAHEQPVASDALIRALFAHL